MRQRHFSSEGIVLSRRKYGEADRIITILSKDFGKIRLIAKGVRKPKSRKRGSLEVFSLIKFTFTVTNYLKILTEVETLKFFPKIRRSLKATALAYFYLEILDSLTADEQKSENLFNILLQSLLAIEVEEKNLRSKRLDFIRKVLIALGFWPNGKKMSNPDEVLEKIMERKPLSIRVGKRILV